MTRRPLAFLGQINLEDAAAYDHERLLPSKGILYFFYEVVSMPWGIDHQDKGCARVFYFDGDAADLREMDFPTDMNNVSRLPKFSVTFGSIADLPDYDEFVYCFGSCDEDDFDRAREILGYSAPEIENMDFKLLGYADRIQSSMLEDCERAFRGIEQMTGEDFERSKEWVLLFQMGTLEQEGFELMFGDCGYIYFYIRKSDLEQRNFDRTWLVLQST